MLLCMFWVIGISQSLSQSFNVCEPLIRRYEAAHGIPHKLLSAISLVESGRKVNGTVIPWPWSINANGKPYVFGTKSEAISMVRKLRQLGVTSIDVGCMQVNLKQHPKAFPNLEAAFDPATNIAYAAKFLKAKKINKGSWVTAVAHYHSSTVKLNLPYKSRVLKTWAKVQNRQMTIHEPEQWSLDMLKAEMESHEGEYVDHISTPGGRRVPMVVRFAPYKGFNKGIPEGNGPKIIRGWPTTGAPKVIINKVGIMPSQKPLEDQNGEVLPKMIRVSPQTDQESSPHKSNLTVMSKFRAKSR